MSHPTLEQFAGFFSTDPDTAEIFCRHLAVVCPLCREHLDRIEGLLARFRHWDPAVVVSEGLDADALFDGLVATGAGCASWWAVVEQRDELVNWGVACVALERARALLAEESSRPRAREFALLGATLTERLDSCYHPEWVNDLKALAYATVIAAEDPADRLSREAVRARLKHAHAATEALDNGTGSESLATEVWGFLSQGAL